jgi:hypothetical protein
VWVWMWVWVFGGGGGAQQQGVSGSKVTWQGCGGEAQVEGGEADGCMARRIERKACAVMTQQANSWASLQGSTIKPGATHPPTPSHLVCCEVLHVEALLRVAVVDADGDGVEGDGHAKPSQQVRQVHRPDAVCGGWWVSGCVSVCRVGVGWGGHNTHDVMFVGAIIQQVVEHEPT